MMDRISEMSEDLSIPSEVSFPATAPNGEDPVASNVGGGHAQALPPSQQQMQASATGGIPAPNVGIPAGTGQPQSLPDQGVNLSTPVEVKTKHRHTRSASFSGHHSEERFGAQTEGKSTEKDGVLRRRSSGIFSRRLSRSGPTALDEVLGSHKLLKDVKPKSSPLKSSPVESCEQEKMLDATFSLKRVPSYRDISGSGDDRHSSSVFEPERRRITILSMDGGGMRGLIAARCLAHLESLLESKTGEQVKLCDYFDFLAGTSTGAILTMMIATPDANGNPLFTGQGCCQFYARNGRNIFHSRWFDPWRGTIRQLYRPKFSARKFENLLKRYLVRDGRALTMRDTLKPFLVTSFDISRATPHIFVRQAAMKDESRNFRLWEVCRGSASAPTYFKPAEVVSTDGTNKTTLIDGGAIQNNPALVAMTHVLGNNEEFPEAMGLNDLLILSLGAGQMDEKFDLKKAKSWGMAGWVRPLMNIMMDGSSDTVDYQLAAGFAGHNCSENYLRIQLFGLKNKAAIMDCATVENVHDLIQFTDDLLKEKAVMRNEYGEKVVHEETYAERLSWFADQLIHQKKLREQGGSSHDGPMYPNHSELGIGPTSRVVSPMFGHLFMHQQLHHNGLSRPMETAKSVRF